jgi:DNA polymerase III delta prime subunit
MLSQELRPKTLDDMAGQEEAKRLIKAIIKNPENAPKVLLFCGSFGTGKCVTGDTRVHTSDGYKRIDELVQNPEYDEEGFMDISPQNIKVVGSTATHYYYGGKRKVVEISSPSFKIRGTYNHRVRVYGANGGLHWKKLRDITTDDFVAIPLKHDMLFDNKSKTYEFMKEDISERDKGYFLGTLFSNILSYGYVNGYYFDCVIICSGNVRYLLKGLKEDYCSVVDNKGICIKTSLNGYIKDFFTDVVTVPEFVFLSNREFICGFLSAVCEYHRKGFDFKFGNFTESVARDLQQLFYLLGIVTHVDAVSGSAYDFKITDSVSRHKAFESLFSDLGAVSGILECYKDYKCSKLKIPNDEYTRYIADKMYQFIKENHNLGELPLSHYMNIMDSDFRFITNKRTKSISIDSYYRLVGVAKLIGVDVLKDRVVKGYNRLLEDYRFVRVSSKKELYNEYDVYDLTVEGTATFTANGLINHNTTASRIVGRELNNIKDDNYDLLNSPFYYEFDSTVVGNVEEIKKLRDIFTVSFGDYWRIVVLDETHTVSSQAQAAMLKMFEETKGKTIYILATTDPQKLLPTIRSRALEINFNDVPVEAIVDNLTKVSEDRGLNLSEEIKLLIADRSGGHMRNAHMLLDKYILLGEEDFKDSIKSSVTLFCDYLIATYKNDKDSVLSNINDLLSIPKDNLQSDWSIVMTESLRSFCGFDCRHKDIKRLVDTYGSDFNIIAQCYMSTWVKNMFVDIPYTQATLLNMYKVVQGALEKKRSQSGVGSVQSVASKYGRPVR